MNNLGWTLGKLLVTAAAGCGEGARLASAVRCGTNRRAFTPVWRGEPARLAGAMRCGEPGRTTGAVRGRRRLRYLGWRRAGWRSGRAVRCHVARTTGCRCQPAERRRLLLAGAVRFGVRPGGAQAVDGATSGGRAGRGWREGWLGARVRRADDVVGESLHCRGQCPGVGGGGDAAKAQDRGGGRRGLGRKEPPPQWWRAGRWPVRPATGQAASPPASPPAPSPRAGTGGGPRRSRGAVPW